MSFKYKSPLIKSRNTSATSDNTSQIVESPSQQSNNKLNEILVYDNTPQLSPAVDNWRGRGCSSPRFNCSRPSRGSPYQWTPPNRFNNSWSSNQSNTPREQSSYSSHRPPFNKYKKQNINNYSNRNTENSEESYFHPSMLEDPWAPLLNNSLNSTA